MFSTYSSQTRMKIYLRLQGFHLLQQRIPHSFNLIIFYPLYVWWPIPLSLTTTYGVSVDFFSSRYLDVSVPLVLVLHNINTAPGFPLGQLWISGITHLPITFRRVIRPLLVLPRHPPKALLWLLLLYH